MKYTYEQIAVGFESDEVALAMFDCYRKMNDPGLEIVDYIEELTMGEDIDQWAIERRCETYGIYIEEITIGHIVSLLIIEMIAMIKEDMKELESEIDSNIGQWLTSESLAEKTILQINSN